MFDKSSGSRSKRPCGWKRSVLDTLSQRLGVRPCSTITQQNLISKNGQFLAIVLRHSTGAPARPVCGGTYPRGVNSSLTQSSCLCVVWECFLCCCSFNDFESRNFIPTVVWRSEKQPGTSGQSSDEQREVKTRSTANLSLKLKTLCLFFVFSTCQIFLYKYI